MSGVADSYDLPDVRAGSQTQTLQLAVLTLVKNVLPRPRHLCILSYDRFIWGVAFSLLKNPELEA